MRVFFLSGRKDTSWTIIIKPVILFLKFDVVNRQSWVKDKETPCDEG